MYLYYVLLFVFISLGFLLKGNLTIDSKHLSSQNRKLYVVLAFGIMLILSAFKSANVGTDTKHYLQIFDWIQESNVPGRYEVGFFYLCKYLGKMFGSFQSLVIISSIVMFVPFAIYIYYESRDVVLSTVIFYLVFFIILNTMMRQGMAMGIALLAIMLYKRNRYIISAMLLAVAVLFHYATIILVIIPITMNIKYKARNVVGCIILALVLVRINAIDRILSFLNINSVYAENSGAGGADALMQTLIVAMSLIIFFQLEDSSKRLYSKTRETGTLIPFSQIFDYKLEVGSTLIYMIFYILTTVFPVASRFSTYFAFGFLTLLPNKVSEHGSGKTRFYICTSIIIAYVTYQTLVFIYRPAWGGFFPYSFCWQE